MKRIQPEGKDKACRRQGGHQDRPQGAAALREPARRYRICAISGAEDTMSCAFSEPEMSEKEKCRLLLPGACEPRLTLLGARTFRDWSLGPHYAARATGARLSLAIVRFGPITVVPHRVKALPFGGPSNLFRPHQKGTALPASMSPCRAVALVVEPPGTAPGSGPPIT